VECVSRDARDALHQPALEVAEEDLRQDLRQLPAGELVGGQLVLERGVEPDKPIVEVGRVRVALLAELPQRFEQQGPEVGPDHGETIAVLSGCFFTQATAWRAHRCGLPRWVVDEQVITTAEWQSPSRSQRE